MFRHNWAIAASLIVVFGLVSHAPAQTPVAGSPSTAYREKGKWVGYVPAHQKYSQPRGNWLFGSSIPDVASCLAPKPRNDVQVATATEPTDQAAESFQGVLLDSEENGTEPRVLAVAFDEPTLAFDPAVDSVPVFDPGVEMFGEACGTGCEPSAQAPAACCPPPRFYGGADYLLWWTDSMGTPPLATTSLAGTDQDLAGVLGQAGTTTLFGGSGFEDDAMSGGRFTLGMWLDPCQRQGVEATYFTIGTQTTSFGASDADFAILARPFYNTVTFPDFNADRGQQDARLIAFDGLVSGSLDVTASTRFEGGKLLLRQAAERECWAEIDFLLGYRWLQLEDGLLIQETTQSLAGATVGTNFQIFDQFDTRNSFHGGELGMSLRRQVAQCWSVELLASLAIGNVNSIATIDGQTITVASTGTTTSDGGLFAQPTNMGRYERDKIATATEVGLKVRRAFGNGIDLTIGYTFLYLSDVLRAGDQIDPNVNVSQFPPGPLVGAAFPQFDAQSSGFWAQGLSFGIEGRY